MNWVKVTKNYSSLLVAYFQGKEETLDHTTLTFYAGQLEVPECRELLVRSIGHPWVPGTYLLREDAYGDLYISYVASYGGIIEHLPIEITRLADFGTYGYLYEESNGLCHIADSVEDLITNISQLKHPISESSMLDKSHSLDCSSLVLPP